MRVAGAAAQSAATVGDDVRSENLGPRRRAQARAGRSDG